MEKQISSRKFKTTVISMCLGFFMVVGAVIGVWAATTQNYKAGFNVSYSVGDNVAAKVRTEYFIPNLDSDGDGYQDGAVTVTTNEAGDTVTEEDGYVHFGAGEDSSEKSVEIGNLKLSPQTPKVYFYFTICSELENGYIQVILGEDYQQQNISVTTKYYNTSAFTSSSSASTVSNAAYANKQYDNVSGRGVKIIRVEIAVKDTNKPATIEGDLSLGLYYSEKEQNVSTLSKSKLLSYAYIEGEDYWEDEYEDHIINSPLSNSYLVFDYIQNHPTYSKTGTDLSEAGDGSIWACKVGTTVYILSKDTIALPADSSYLFYNFDHGGPMSDDPSYDADGDWWDARYANLQGLTFNNIDTSNVTNMSYMFMTGEHSNGRDWYFATLDLSKFDTSSVTDMSYMFAVDENGFVCPFFTIYVSTLWSTASVTNGSEMFDGCGNLVGAVEYDWDKVDYTMANWETGYLTLK